ncbi:MAG TPA: amino acid permease [Candidatus Binatia bacterium]|nr:amino acid permease [Candidatus Binatia bacterium]
MIRSRLFHRKSLDARPQDGQPAEPQLRRALGPLHLTLLGIGAIIGAGIFATIGTAAAGDLSRPGAGPALMVSFVITAIVCGFSALCYAEFASLVPLSGSAYSYTYATLGELAAWIIGWDLIIEYAVGNVAVAISWANYCKTFLAGFGIAIPAWLAMDYRTAAKIVDATGTYPVYRDAPHVFGIPIVFNLLAVGVVTLITAVLVWGIRESARVNMVMVGIKILVLLFFIFVGCWWVQPVNWIPFAPNGWKGISASAAIVFFAYIGFDAVSTVAEETKDPQRNLPLGILASLVVCTIFYVVVSAVFTGLISYSDLKTVLATEQAEPLTLALKHANPQPGWAVGVVAFGSVIAHTAVLLVFQLGQPRIFFAMARDGLLPPVFRAVHPRFRTPYVSTIVTGVFVASFAAIASIDEMVDLTNIGTLFAFILVCAGIVVLRITDPARPRPFRVPSGWGWTLVLYCGFALGTLLLPLSGTSKTGTLALSAALFVVSRNHIFPVLGICSCLYLVYYLPPVSWFRFAAWLNCGLVIYAGYGVVHSRLTGRHHSKQPAEYNAYAAYIGAWLALIGTILLFCLRGVELWLEALQKSEEMTGLTHAGFALAEVLRLEPWLELSWFLLIPLALTAFVLCPIIIGRALRARQEKGRDGYFRMTMTSLAVAGTLEVVAVAYGLLIAAHIWGL